MPRETVEERTRRVVSEVVAADAGNREEQVKDWIAEEIKRQKLAAKGSPGKPCLLYTSDAADE